MKYLALLFLILASSPAFAQADSVNTGIGIVEDFYGETRELLKGVKERPAVASFLGKAARDNEAALSELRSLRWTETPGVRRFERVKRTVETYLEGQIDGLRRLRGLAGGDREYLKGVINGLAALKRKQLAQLDESLRAETYRKKALKPVPLIDRSPFEKGPGEGGGIWYR